MAGTQKHPSPLIITISHAFMPLRIDQQAVVARYRDYHIYDAYADLTDLSTIFQIKPTSHT
jgi:hypothetical protein